MELYRPTNQAARIAKVKEILFLLLKNYTIQLNVTFIFHSFLIQYCLFVCFSDVGSRKAGGRMSQVPINFSIIRFHFAPLP